MPVTGAPACRQPLLGAASRWTGVSRARLPTCLEPRPGWRRAVLKSSCPWSQLCPHHLGSPSRHPPPRQPRAGSALVTVALSCRQLHLSPVKLAELHADLKIQERDELNWKKLKVEGLDEDGEKEAKLMRNLHGACFSAYHGRGLPSPVCWLLSTPQCLVGTREGMACGHGLRPVCPLSAVGTHGQVQIVCQEHKIHVQWQRGC